LMILDWLGIRRMRAGYQREIAGTKKDQWGLGSRNFLLEDQRRTRCQESDLRAAISMPL
jgi:hypothetical protein